MMCPIDKPNISPLGYLFQGWVSIALGVLLISNLAEAGPLFPQGSNSFELVTGEVSTESRSRWDRLFSADHYVFGEEPAEFLRDHTKRLPIGRVLDIAMGEGRNAVYLAKKGFDVVGVDISKVALRKAKRLAKKAGVGLTFINKDLNQYQIDPGTYEVIVNIDYLQRSLFEPIKKGLKSGGVVVFENTSVEQLDIKKAKPMPREWLLEKGELLRVFHGYEILAYEELRTETEARDRLIARKP